MAKNQKTFREEVAEEIVRQIEAGTAPWQKPWEPGRIKSLPHNPATGGAYRGMNALWLDLQGSDDPRWMTYRQAAASDAQVRKGEKSLSIEYWKWTDRQPVLDGAGKPLKDENGKTRYEDVRLARPKVFYAKVFNAEQIDGLEPYQTPEPGFEPTQKAEQVLAATNLTIKHDQADRAFYNPASDAIHLPGREGFTSAHAYYATALHEAGHATGHASRLARSFGPHGSEIYAREELKAEIASYMTARTLGVGHDPSNHAAYVKSWLKVLKDDPNEIFRAARDAEVINTWIMEPEKRPELERRAQEQKAAMQRQEKDGREQTMSTTKETVERHYLAVPFEEKNAAKAAGAKWDRKAKAWYAPDGVDLSKLAAWNTSSGKAPETPLVPPQVEFAQSCRDHGLSIQGDIVMDGQWHRVSVDGDKKGQESGSYRGYLDGRPSGQITNFKGGGTVKWVATGQTLTAQDREALKAESANKRLERKTEQSQSFDAAAKKAYGVWKNSNWAEKSASPYLKEKEIGAWSVKHDGKGGLIVPIRNVEGRLQSLQFIDKDGNKRMMKDGRKADGMHFIDPQKQLGQAPILIAEGYATAATLYEATKLPTVCAFDAGNLKSVATAMREKYPEKTIVIAADNDRTGLDKAREAAAAIQGDVVAPVFTKAELEQGLTDFNDLARTHGSHKVVEALIPALKLDKGQTKGAEPDQAMAVG
jgi:putative DNA primase/helicase